MPKKQPKNAFFFYMLHFKEEEARKGRFYPGGMSEVSIAASKPWNTMNAQQRGPFEKKAKEAKMGPRKEVEKYTSQGIPLWIIEKEQKDLENEHRTMLRTIKEMVQSAFNDNTIGSQEYFFISANYFINVNENYLPAEIALVKFSFEIGIVSKFHTYVNPEKVPMGYQFSTRENSEKTHRLPIPPNAKGERNYRRILDEIKKFVGQPTPILFTTKENIPIVKSIFDQFMGEDDTERIRVYPLHQIFYEIKEEAVRSSVDGMSFKSIHIAEEHLRRDDYAYLTNTACAYHEEIDCVKHCALAHVQKWAYIFCDHICFDLNIKLIPGKHLPPEIDVSHVVQSDFSSSRLNFTDSSTYNHETERKQYDNKSATESVSNVATASHWPARPNSPTSSSHDDDFPSLGSHSRRAGASSKKRSDMRDVNNPWNTSSSSSNDSNARHEKHYQNEAIDISFRSADTSYSRAMGRGSVLFRNESGFGRGRGRDNDDDRPSRKERSSSPRHSRHESKRYHSREYDSDEERRRKNRRHK